jgi:hypothetical protein
MSAIRIKSGFFHWIGVIAIGISLGVGMQFVQASWTPAPSNPPNDNVAGPITVGPNVQTKANGAIIADFFGARKMYSSSTVDTDTATTLVTKDYLDSKVGGNLGVRLKMGPGFRSSTSERSSSVQCDAGEVLVGCGIFYTRTGHVNFSFAGLNGSNNAPPGQAFWLVGYADNVNEVDTCRVREQNFDRHWTNWWTWSAPGTTIAPVARCLQLQ